MYDLKNLENKKRKSAEIGYDFECFSNVKKSRIINGGKVWREKVCQ